MVKLSGSHSWRFVKPQIWVRFSHASSLIRTDEDGDVLEDSGIDNDPFAAGIPWYDVNGQFLPDYSPGLGYNSNLEAITVPIVPQVAELEHRNLNQETLVQTFYEGPKKQQDTINWVEKEPMQVPEAVQNRYNEPPFVYTNRKTVPQRRHLEGLLP